MPELPEVETVVRGLKYLAGQRLQAIEVFDARVWFESEVKPVSFQNLRLTETARRGKYLIFRFEKGLSLVGHLRMTGKFLEQSSPTIAPHIRQVIGQKKGKGLQVRSRFIFENHRVLFIDTRRFGTLTAVRSEEKYFAKKKIAPDPILDPERALGVFLQAMRTKKKPIKALLLDQSAVAGVGNIYADEALHAVGVHPTSSSSKVKDPRALWEAILVLLHRAIEAGGSTVNDYVNAEGEKGEYAQNLLVYKRAGKACSTCGKKIQKVQLAGRSTHFCTKCQPKKSR